MLNYLIILKVVLTARAAKLGEGQDGGVEHGGGGHPDQFVEPYVGSYQVEDSCQFVLCGQDFSQEFGVGVSPTHRSCSGDCHDLATSLITNRFTKDFLWSKCASMCSDKYNFSSFR